MFSFSVPPWPQWNVKFSLRFHCFFILYQQAQNVVILSFLYGLLQWKEEIILCFIEQRSRSRWQNDQSPSMLFYSWTVVWSMLLRQLCFGGIILKAAFPRSISAAFDMFKEFLFSLGDFRKHLHAPPIHLRFCWSPDRFFQSLLRRVTLGKIPTLIQYLFQQTEFILVQHMQCFQ